MNKITKNKKIFIFIIIGLALIILIASGIFLFIKNNDEKEQNNEITNNYVAYISINPTIKLEFSQTCRNNNSEKNINSNCDDPIVTKYELINDDAKTIYKDVNLVDITDQLWNVLDLINTTAKEHDIEVNTIEIYSDWNKIEQYISENNTKYIWNYEININTKDELKDIEKSLMENKTLLTVKFDTDGGNNIETIEIEKGTKINAPENPLKEGYKFIEWQLDNKKFDFNSTIEENITLVAKWEKIKNTNNSNANNNNQNNNNSNTDTDTNTPPTEEIVYFDIPWDIINDGTYQQFAKEHGITFNLVADIKYQCTGHFSSPSDPRGYKKGDVVIAYGHMDEVCVENCDGCTGEECEINPPKYETKFQFGACGCGGPDC